MMDKQAYTQQLQQLLPPGQAWPRDKSATLTKLLGGIAEGVARFHRRVDDLANELDPRTTVELLPDWERVCGLPDECSVQSSQTLAERQSAVHAKWTSRGGQSRQFFIDLAKTLGFDVTVNEFRVFTCESAIDEPICDEPWSFAWQVNAPETTIREFTCDSHCEEPLRIWGNWPLECVLSRYKPAHTHVIFSYSHGG